MRYKVASCVSLMIAMLLAYVGIVQMAYGQTNPSSPSLYPQNSKPFNITMDKWLENYWKWFGSIDKDLLPRKNIDKFCGTNQNGPVWFLDFKIPNGGKDNLSNTCEIPSGKAIFIPSHVGECDRSERMNKDTGELKPYPDNDIKSCAIDGNNGGHIELKIDGKDFYNGRYKTEDPEKSPSEYTRFRTTTGFFNLTYVEDNHWGVRKGTYRALADGYFSIVQPLAVGNHTIYLHSDTTVGTKDVKYVMDQTWHVIIKNNTNSAR